MQIDSVPDRLPRFNHYVPRFVLENFTDNGKLSILDKHTLKRFKLPAYRAMGEKDFTNVKLDDHVLSFENKFTYLEERAAPVISEIIKQKSLKSLSPMDQATLHMFVVVQLLRSKRRRLDHAAVSAKIKERWPEADINPLKDKMTDEEFGKFFSLNFTFSKLDDLVAPLVSKHSFLMIKDCADELYISDSPMVMHNDKQYGPYGNIGLAVPHIQIYYPLSHLIVLGYICPLAMREMEEKHLSASREVDSHFSRKFMSPTGLSPQDKVAIEKSRQEIRRAKDYYAMMKDERVVPMSSEVLLFLNSLQVLSSYRYLASKSDNFDFAMKALSERPNWKMGRGVHVS